jgi:type II secretory pathway pseudopilin PulG
MTTSATPAGSRSFTLMELLLVVVILSLAAALVLPRLGPAARRIGARSASYDLLWLLRQARWWAAGEGQICRVHLAPAPGGYTAQVTHQRTDDDPPQPLRAEWARLEQLPAVKKLLQIPPDRGVSRRKELTVRFTPWGVSEDYVIALAEEPVRTGMRIEVRRPSGLAWLLPEDAPSAFDRESMAALENYWEAHCRGLGR